MDSSLNGPDGGVSAHCKVIEANGILARIVSTTSVETDLKQ